MRSQVVSLQEGDVVDLALTPIGPDGGATDSSDGSANWLKVTEVSGDVGPIAVDCRELELVCEPLVDESVIRIQLTGSPDGCGCQTLAVFIDDQPSGIFEVGEGGTVDVPLPEGCGAGLQNPPGRSWCQRLLRVHLRRPCRARRSAVSPR